MNPYKNKTPKTLIGLLAVTALIFGVFTTGCNTVQKVKDGHPLVYEIGKGAAHVALTYYLGQSTDTFVAENRTALLDATNRVFADNESPADVALALSTELEGIYPDDPATRDAILQQLAIVLRPDEGVPASGPGEVYKADLADELDPGSPPESASIEPRGDVTFGEWLISSKARQANRAYYAVQEADPEEVERARKLRALMLATNPETGNVNHDVYVQEAP